MHGKPRASMKVCGSRRLRLGEAPLRSPGNPHFKRIVGAPQSRSRLRRRRCKDEPRPVGEAWALKRSGWFYERLFGARSAAGSMTPLSQAYARERTQIPDAPLPCVGCGTRLAGASSRFLCLSFFAAAKKVSAAPHRGNTNRPLTKQGKAKAPRTLTKRRAGKQHEEKAPKQAKATPRGRPNPILRGNPPP
ncbi:hypothetical protein R20943_01277 [Paraburkholderia aspalathi]|nr:hypothetical protein R20943_01277 [Paraburkholderia aspalathi]